MNLVKINVYGEAYYSGASYDETIFLLEEDYKSLNCDFDGMEISLGELDGKHSEVYGDVSVKIIEEDMQNKYNFEVNNDSDTLYWELSEYTDELSAMVERANKYIANLDSLVKVSYTIKKSKVDELNRYVESLK